MGRDTTRGRSDGRSAGPVRGGPSDGRPTDRGTSEFTGVAILVAVTVLVTGSVGMFVLLDPGAADDGPTANFSFQHIQQSSVLIVSHDRGDSFAAGNLTLRSDDAEARWSELADTDNETLVEPGSSVQLSRRNAYGERVRPNTEVSVVHTPPVGNETVLETWLGS